MREMQTERTRNAIIAAFIRLMEQKSFEKITIQEIADETPISRSNFYRYFHDKYEIAEYLQSRALEQIELYSDVLTKHIEDPRRPSLQSLNKMIQSERATMNVLLKIKAEKVDLLGQWQERMQQEYMQQHRNDSARAEACIYSAVLTQLLIYPLQNNVPIENLMKEMTDIQIRAFLNLLSLGDDVELIETLHTKLLTRPVQKTIV